MAMTLQRFRALAEAWGGDLSRWPEAERMAAAQLLESGDGIQARTSLDEALRLDATLDMHVPAPAPALYAHILEASAALPRSLADVGAAHGCDRSASALAGATESPPGTGVPRSILPGTEEQRGAAVAAMGSSYIGRRWWGVVGMWRELGGLRIAGPALAAALVLGVAMAELRSGMEVPVEADADAVVPEADAEALLAEALLAGDYEEFVL